MVVTKKLLKFVTITTNFRALEGSFIGIQNNLNNLTTLANAVISVILII